MRRGLLQDLANTACQMLVGWRLSEDLDWLVQQGRGDLDIDLLTGATTVNGTAVHALHIGEEVRLWLSERLEQEAVPTGTVRSALLTGRGRDDQVMTRADQGPRLTRADQG